VLSFLFFFFLEKFSRRRCTGNSSTNSSGRNTSSDTTTVTATILIVVHVHGSSSLVSRKRNVSSGDHTIVIIVVASIFLIKNRVAVHILGGDVVGVVLLSGVLGGQGRRARGDLLLRSDASRSSEEGVVEGFSTAHTLRGVEGEHAAEHVEEFGFTLEDFTHGAGNWLSRATDDVAGVVEEAAEELGGSRELEGDLAKALFELVEVLVVVVDFEEAATVVGFEEDAGEGPDVSLGTPGHAEDDFGGAVGTGGNEVGVGAFGAVEGGRTEISNSEGLADAVLAGFGVFEEDVLRLEVGVDEAEIVVEEGHSLDEILAEAADVLDGDSTAGDAHLAGAEGGSLELEDEAGVRVDVEVIEHLDHALSLGLGLHGLEDFELERGISGVFALEDLEGDGGSAFGLASVGALVDLGEVTATNLLDNAVATLNEGAFNDTHMFTDRS